MLPFIPLIIGGLIVVTIISIITIDFIIERVKKKNKNAMSIKIKKIYEEGNYIKVDVGLYNNSNRLIDELSLKGEDIDNNVYQDQVLILNRC